MREAKYRRQKSGQKNKQTNKNRFGELPTKEIQEITDNADPVTTIKGDLWSNSWIK